MNDCLPKAITCEGINFKGVHVVEPVHLYLAKGDFMAEQACAHLALHKDASWSGLRSLLALVYEKNMAMLLHLGLLQLA